MMDIMRPTSVIILCVAALSLGGCGSGSSSSSAGSSAATSAGSSGGPSTPSSTEDQYVASEISNAGTTFLWNRDLVDINGGVNHTGICLLSGSYTVTGTQTVAGNPSSSENLQFNLDWTFTNCRQTDSQVDMTIDGEVQDQGNTAWVNSQETSVAATLTSPSITLTGTWTDSSGVMNDLSVYKDCDLQLNVINQAGSWTFSGSICGRSFQ